MSAPSAFPLRFRSGRLRDVVRELAERDGLSQNEFIERAVEREVILGGALFAEELAEAAARLAELSAEQHALIVERSLREFGAGEAGRDPVQMRALHTPAPQITVSAEDECRDDPLGVLEAFESARS